jgi:hypothetical protein
MRLFAASVTFKRPFPLIVMAIHGAETAKTHKP